jgi:acetolactate synthase-1/3 small subunit
MVNGNGEKRKHIIGLLVEDQPGVLERLAGLFLRRGFNIETIIVGKTAQEGVSHIVISLIGDDKTLEQLEKQVYKIIEVVKVIELTVDSVVREHCLIKVSSTPENRQDIINFVELNKATVLQTNHKSIIVEIVEEPKKVDEFVLAMKPFGIKELSRTGINAMTKA